MRASLLALAACAAPPARAPRPEPPRPAATAPGIDAKDSEGWTQLQRAAEAGDVAKIEDLLARGANLEATDPRAYFGMNAFAIAVVHDKVEAALLLLRRGSRAGANELAAAVVNGEDDLVDALLAARTPVAGALAAAAKYDRVAAMKRLIAAGSIVDEANPSDHGFTPLIVACQENKLAAATLLLDAGAHAEQHDADGTTALHWAVYGARPIEIHMYRDLGGPHDTIYRPQADAPIVRLLLARGAKLDAVDPSGNTALHEAVMMEAASAVKVLVDAGANKRVKNRDGKTAYDIAHDRGYASIEKLVHP